MSCPSSGDDGRGPQLRSLRARPRFHPSGSSAPDSPAPAADDGVLLEAESSDASEQQFAASLEAPSRPARRRFIPGPSGGCRPASVGGSSAGSAPADVVTHDELEAICDSEKESAQPSAADAANLETAAESPQPAASELTGEAATASAASSVNSVEDVYMSDTSAADAPQWRQEVAARLNHYHSRRTKKPPRYPSLALKFDPPAYAAPPAYVAEAPRVAAVPAQSRSEVATAAAPAPEELEEAPFLATDASNIIEFPRPLVPPPPRPDELAESILDVPRILDAPEAVPKQVPLGGIILQQEETAPASELELPLPVAPLSRRLLAAGGDATLVLGATLMFALIANRVAALLPSARVLLGLGVALPAILWAVFQYTFLVYTGSTPGMRLLGLRLSDFDGSTPGPDTRRWRALAMALSAVSLGLGFLWCLLDEDTLCWHDRITRTYLDAGRSADSCQRSGPVFPQRLLAELRRMDAFLRRRDEETSEEPPSPPLG